MSTALMTMLAGSMLFAADFRDVTCEGTYPHHLQGVCIDDQAIYWSFTTQLVKTDLDGKLLKKAPVANHHGDLCIRDGKLYVAVNLGKFNDPQGNADSWVYVYNADDLSLAARHNTPDVFHGAGGIGFRDDRFYVVGGLPDGVEENYVYEYDGAFKLIKKHVVKSGHTHLGIQTAAFANDRWWFGCYGDPKILLVTDADFNMIGRYEFDSSLGIAGLPDGRMLAAIGGSDKGKNHVGTVRIATADDRSGLRFASEPDTAVIKSPVGTGKAGFGGDGGPADQALLDQPFDVVFDGEGNLYLSDTGNHRVRRVDAKTGVITTVAGNGEKGFSGDGGPATSARLDEPYGLAVDPTGNLYFADRLNFRVRRVDGQTGVITTVAGNGKAATSGDGGPGPDAGIVEPNDVALDGRGRLYIADVAGHRVRVVDLATGIIQTFAGNGQGRHDGDGGLAKDAALSGPRAVKLAPDGALLIFERNGNTLRSVSAGVITTIAGTGKKGSTGDGGPAKNATFDGPKEFDVDSSGNILIVDTENHAIRRIDAKTGIITTVAGDGKQGGEGDGSSPTTARLDRPHGVAFSPDGVSFVIGDTNNHRIRRVGP